MILFLAGSLAEQEILGHFIKDGYSRDFEIWRWGTGRDGADDSIDVTHLIRAGMTGARGLVADNREAIMRVYQLFVDRAPQSGGTVLPFSEPLVVTRDEVRAAVLNAAQPRLFHVRVTGCWRPRAGGSTAHR